MELIQGFYIAQAWARGIILGARRIRRKINRVRLSIVKDRVTELKQYIGLLIVNGKVKCRRPVLFMKC